MAHTWCAGSSSAVPGSTNHSRAHHMCADHAALLVQQHAGHDGPWAGYWASGKRDTPSEFGPIYGLDASACAQACVFVHADACALPHTLTGMWKCLMLHAYVCLCTCAVSVTILVYQEMSIT